MVETYRIAQISERKFQMPIQNRYKKEKAEALPVMVEGKRWYNLQDGANYMAAKPHFVRDLIRRGKIKFRILGHGFVLDRLDMDEYLTNKTA